MTSAPSAKRLVLLLMAVTSAGYVCRVAVTVVAPGIMHDFGLSQAQMGTVFSAFLLGYTLFQIPSGALADRIGARNIFLALCAGWTLLTALTGLAAFHGFALALALPQLWLIRLMFGVVSAPTYPTAVRALSLAAPPRLHARANSLVLASVGLGSAFTPLLLAPLARDHGWRAALLAAAALAALAGLLWLRFAPRHFHTPAISAPPHPANPRRSLLRSPGLWFLSASYFLQAYLGYIFVFWFYLYLVQVRHFELLKAAGFTALPWLATVFAIPLGGLLSDIAVVRLGATWGRRSVPLAALGAAGIFLVLGARTPSPYLAVASLTACTVLVLCTECPFWATMTQLAPTRGGLAGGAMNFAGNLGGMISPALTPWLASRIGWQSALSLTASLALLAALLWLGVRLDVAEP